MCLSLEFFLNIRLEILPSDSFMPLCQICTFNFQHVLSRHLIGEILALQLPLVQCTLGHFFVKLIFNSSYPVCLTSQKTFPLFLCLFIHKCINFSFSLSAPTPNFYIIMSQHCHELRKGSSCFCDGIHLSAVIMRYNISHITQYWSRHRKIWWRLSSRGWTHRNTP